MITKSQYKEALAIVLAYERQCDPIQDVDGNARVKLSAFGLEMQGKHKKNLRGVVIEKMLAGMYDYSVNVKWDGKGRAEWMHEHQIEYIK